MCVTCLFYKITLGLFLISITICVSHLWCSYYVSTCVWHVFLINWWCNWWWWWWWWWWWCFENQRSLFVFHIFFLWSSIHDSRQLLLSRHAALHDKDQDTKHAIKNHSVNKQLQTPQHMDSSWKPTVGYHANRAISELGYTYINNRIRKNKT